MASRFTVTLAHVPIVGPLAAEHLAKDFAVFGRACWSIVFPGRKLVWSPAYDLACEVLTLMSRRDPAYLRVIWNMPPRCAKSFLFSVCYPVWVWLSDPSHCFACCSYSMDLSIDHSIARRNLILSPWFQRLFGERFQLAGDRNLTSQFSNDHRGTMLASSPGSRLTGFGFDAAIIDDLVSPIMALSDSERTTATAWFDSTLRQRANDPATASICCVSQRTHELDVVGHLLQSELGVWQHFKIPLVAETPEQHVFPVSGKVWGRPAGDVLMPKRFTAKVVEELQTRRLVYAGQYQQEPAPLAGNLVKASDLMYYGGVDPVSGKLDEELPDSFDMKVISVDCAFKDYSDSDCTAILTIGVKDRKRFVLDVVNAHLDVSGMELAVRNARDRWGPVNAILIEEAASGVAVLQRLKVNVGGAVGVVPSGGKVARMMAASPEFQAHDWVLSRNAASTPIVREQLLFFPKTRRDDIVDAISQASIWLQRNFYSSEPALIVRGDSRFGITELREYLAGGAPAAIPASVSEKVARGKPLTDAEEWTILGASIPGAFDD